MNIRVKIIGAALITLAICIGGTSLFLARLAENRMVSHSSSNVISLGSLALNEVKATLIDGHNYEIQRLLENILGTPSILSARIVSDNGVVLRSGAAGEVGIQAPGFEQAGDGPRSMRQDNTIIYRVPVKNQSECFSCHGDTATNIGVIELVYDISSGDREVSSTRRFLLLSGLLILVIVGGALTATLNRIVMYPVETLVESMRSVREGDLNARTDPRGSDEIARLGESFNTMMVEVKAVHERALVKERDISRVKAGLDHKVMLEELNTQLQHKVKEVESANKAVLSLSKELKHKNVELEKMVERMKRINEVGSVLTSIIDYKELMKIIIKTASETLRLNKGTIYVRKSNSAPITLIFRPDSGFIEEDSGNVDLDPRFQEMLLEGKQVFNSKGGGEDSTLGVPLKMKGQVIGGMLLEGGIKGNITTHDDMEVLDTMANQAVVALENAWLYETVKTNYFGTIQSLVNALEASDRYTKGHSERVRSLGIELAKYMGLDYRELEVFEHAAILHDIGKIGIDSAVLNKADALTNTEFSLIRAHPIIGDEILGPIGTLEGVRTTILQHHERYDGKGYPYGISGEEITLKARVLAVIDTFDAMLTDRPYRKALTREQALDEVHKGSGTQFDPAVVKAFFQMLKDNEELMKTAGYAGRK